MNTKLNLLLSCLRALYQLYQHMHWTSSGENYYSDHLLFERLYTDIEPEMDQVAEKALGLSESNDAIDFKEDAKLTLELVEKLDGKDVDSAIFAEKALIDMIADMMASETTDGVEDMFQSIANKHEEHLYLLKQRVKNSNILVRLFKVASRLDSLGHYDVAVGINNVMKDLVNRVGINVDDLVSLADELDASGQTNMANYIDNIIKSAVDMTDEEMRRKIEELRAANEKIRAEQGLSPKHEDPIKQTKKEKEQQRQIRLQMESDEDVRLEVKEKKKLERELGRKKKNNEYSYTSEEQKEVERKLQEEWLKHNTPETETKSKKNKVPDEYEAKEDLNFESAIKKYPSDSIYSKDTSMACVSQGHENRLAVVKMEHGDTLGEGLPPLTFCEECATNVKLEPLGNKIFDVKDPNVRNFLINRFYPPARDEKYVLQQKRKVRDELWKNKHKKKRKKR